MNATVAVDLAVYLTAIAFGLYAIPRWRRHGVPVLAGLGLATAPRLAADIGTGVLITTGAMIGIFAVELALGVIQAGVADFRPVFALLFGLVLIVQGLIDEVLMRGMLVSGLSMLLGGRPIVAVLIGGVLFAATHMFLAGASPLSVISNGLGGVMYGLAFVLTGRIWLGFGLHFAWNFVQGPILGFTLSGHPTEGGVFQIADLGPAWLTGGAYGPEGGVVGIAFRFVIIGAVFAWNIAQDVKKKIYIESS
jgi:membrane protease YdiL (CAAX protease family)